LKLSTKAKPTKQKPINYRNNKKQEDKKIKNNVKRNRKINLPTDKEPTPIEQISILEKEYF